MKPKRIISLEEKIEIMKNLVEDHDYMKTLNTDEKHSYHNHLLNLQREYKKIHGQYYTPTDRPKSI